MKLKELSIEGVLTVISRFFEKSIRGLTIWGLSALQSFGGDNTANVSKVAGHWTAAPERLSSFEDTEEAPTGRDMKSSL